MARPTPFCFRPTFWLIIVAALLATSACTRSNASAGSPHSAPAQSSQPTRTQPASAQPAPPPAGPISELAELKQKAAAAGDGYAMYRLGCMYATGSGVQKDYKEALSWYQKAAAKGNADALYSLGEAYEHGQGVRENVQQAVNWYHDAALRGSQPAKAALARLGETIEDHP